MQFGRYTWMDTTNVFVRNPEDRDAKQHGSRIRVIVIMITRGKVCKYVAGRNQLSGKYLCYL